MPLLQVVTANGQTYKCYKVESHGGYLHCHHDLLCVLYLPHEIVSITLVEE